MILSRLLSAVLTFRRLCVLLLLPLALALPAGAQPTTKLKPETIAAFDRYVKLAEAEMQKQLDTAKPFLWVDGDPARRRRVREGEILVHQTQPGVEVPSGLLHDWLGTMFVPGTSLQPLLALLQDFDRHQRIYPEVIASKLLARDGNLTRGYLRLRKKKVLTVVLNTEHEARFFPLGDTRWYSRSYSTRIAQVNDAGGPKEHELPSGEDSGFLWRLYAYWRLEQADGGVFAECRTISLSRAIPRGLGWLIKPFIRDVPRESLVGTLEATRQALH